MSKVAAGIGIREGVVSLALADFASSRRLVDKKGPYPRHVGVGHKGHVQSFSKLHGGVQIRAYALLQLIYLRRGPCRVKLVRPDSPVQLHSLKSRLQMRSILCGAGPPREASHFLVKQRLLHHSLCDHQPDSMVSLDATSAESIPPDIWSTQGQGYLWRFYIYPDLLLLRPQSWPTCSCYSSCCRAAANNALCCVWLARRRLGCETFWTPGGLELPDDLLCLDIGLKDLSPPVDRSHGAWAQEALEEVECS